MHLHRASCHRQRTRPPRPALHPCPIPDSAVHATISCRDSIYIPGLAHIARVCFKCFKGMLQVLCIDVAKVDQDIAHVVMVIHVCFKCMFQIFYLFHTYVASILSEYCKSRFECCIHMHVASIFFQVFHMYVCKGFI
jgi:hypothetical protein